MDFNVSSKMAHAEGWIKAYELIEEGLPVPDNLKKTVLSNRNGIGETMLHWYTIEGDTHVVERIIELGFDVNTTNDFRQTPLYECATIDRWEMVELLLKNGADPSIKDQEDEDIFEHLEFYGKEKQLAKLRELTSRR